MAVSDMYSASSRRWARLSTAVTGLLALLGTAACSTSAEAPISPTGSSSSALAAPAASPLDVARALGCTSLLPPDPPGSVSIGLIPASRATCTRDGMFYDIIVWKSRRDQETFDSIVRRGARILKYPKGLAAVQGELWDAGLHDDSSRLLMATPAQVGQSRIAAATIHQLVGGTIIYFS